MEVAQKHIPATRPTFNPVIQPPLPTRAVNKATPTLVMTIKTNEERNIAPTPFLALGSFTFTPDALIQASLNKNEYHRAPKRKNAIAATSTASQLMFEKESVFMIVGFGL